MASSKRSTLIIFPPSSGCEVADWLCERYGIKVRVKRHSVPFFQIAINLAGGFDYPFLNYQGQKLSSSRALVNAMEGLLPTDKQLPPPDPADRPTAAALWNDVINPKLAFAVSRWAYRFLLPEKSLTYGPITHGTPGWQRAFVWLTYPLMAKLVGASLGLDKNPASAMEAMIREAYDAVDDRLRGGAPYLFGERPCYVDYGFAGLAAPTVLESRYGGGGLLPNLQDAPTAMHTLVEELRERPGGQLIDRMYGRFR
ncbi:MAG: hypothetical protein U9Q81_22485 [Pseudomonadota bacterium]|nr:hypothetical protein [Pseudomonadota bacterium]